MASAFQLAVRAFLKVLLQLAQTYHLTLDITRDSEEHKFLQAFRKVAKKTHPDKGGNAIDFRRLQEVREQWERARTADRSWGRRWEKMQHAEDDSLVPVQKKSVYRIRGASTLLTYHGFTDKEQWPLFLSFVEASLKKWDVMHWCATFERSHTQKLHAHLALQFHHEIERTTRFFAYDGRAPNAQLNDYLGEGPCKRRYQLSVNRSFFYVWADKIGTERDSNGNPCVKGDHQPNWTDARSRYQVMGKWCENLWKDRKLTHDQYEQYLFLSRDGVQNRKRNLDAVREREKQELEDEEKEKATKRVRSKFDTFEPVPEAVAWLRTFQEERDRYAFLVVIGPSLSRKTEWAKSLFSRPLQLDIGTLDHFPNAMRNFDRAVHDAIVLDDIRDFKFLVHHQEKIQGKVDRVVSFGETPCGGYAYSHWLWRIPIVVTANFTTKGRDMLYNDDFLGHPDNRVVVQRQAVE